MDGFVLCVRSAGCADCLGFLVGKQDSSVQGGGPSVPAPGQPAVTCQVRAEGTSAVRDRSEKRSGHLKNASTVVAKFIITIVAVDV